MTQTSVANPVTRPRTDLWLRSTTVLAACSGAALVVDTVTIAIINSSFNPLDSVLFLIGFVGMLATGATWSLHQSQSLTGLRRAASAVGLYLAFAVVLGGISFGADQFGRHTFSSANQGLHGEWSFFSIGVVLLALATYSWRGSRAQTSSVA